MEPSFQPLLGPPEIHLFSSPFQPMNPIDPFIKFYKSQFTSTKQYPKPMQGFTNYNSPTFVATGNPCLDFFFHVVPGIPTGNLLELLDQAWDYSPLTTLKLICHLRDVRGTGKSDKEGFYTAALWLYKNHPKTLAANMESFARFGYFKDLPEILLRLIEGIDARKEREQNRSKKAKKGGYRQEEVNQDVFKLRARIARKEKVKSMAEKAMERYHRDSSYRIVHDSISQVFAEQLISDLKFLNSGKPEDLFKISLASKWCPSLDSSFDRSTLLCENIARRVFSIESYSEYEGIRQDEYAYRARDRLRKEYLSPLRRALHLPETYMSAKSWKSLPYNRVPSVAMQTYKDLFKKHDESRFQTYLESVERGEAKIAAGALLPHEIIEFAICDISSSMQGIAFKVATALSLIISEISESPWKGKMIIFNNTAELHRIEGETLRSKMESIRQAEIGNRANLLDVFDLILKVAINGKIKKEKMIRKVFVFSDMEFDQVSEIEWETDYEAIRRKYRESGYVSVPEIVFWNLRCTRAIPVDKRRKGVALVSGFSKNLVKLFLEGGGVVTPEFVMNRAIAGPEYRKLVVVD